MENNVMVIINIMVRVTYMASTLILAFTNPWELELSCLS